MVQSLSNGRKDRGHNAVALLGVEPSAKALLTIKSLHPVPFHSLNYTPSYWGRLDILDLKTAQRPLV